MNAIAMSHDPFGVVAHILPTSQQTKGPRLRSVRYARRGLFFYKYISSTSSSISILLATRTLAMSAGSEDCKKGLNREVM